jgi:hypothetical protein
MQVQVDALLVPLAVSSHEFINELLYPFSNELRLAGDLSVGSDLLKK